MLGVFGQRSIFSQLPAHNSFLYGTLEANRLWTHACSTWIHAGLHAQLKSLQCLPLANTQLSEAFLSAAMTMNERWSRDYEKPSFNIPDVEIGSKFVTVEEQVVREKAFCQLRHFKREISRKDPKVLLVAPMSGHYATLLRNTVKSLLPDHEVYITDWANARDVPKEEGSFGFDDYVEYLLDFLQHLGRETHLVAVCQPTVPALVAAAHLEESNSDCKPASLTLMGGPIDTAEAPTEVSKFAVGRSIDWFREKVIAKVPVFYKGQGRLVYPGTLQLGGFMSMNLDKHLQSHLKIFEQLAWGDITKAEKGCEFYDEYLAVCDLPAHFYLETVERVFLNRDLACGTMRFRGRVVDCEAIQTIPMFTIEGEKDDIAAPGQTLAAHRICSGLPDSLRFHYLQPDAGHYGIFSGRLWRKEIAPRVTSFIRQVKSDLHYDAPAEDIAIRSFERANREPNET